MTAAAANLPEDFPVNVLDARCLPAHLRGADDEVGDRDGVVDAQEVTALDVRLRLSERFGLDVRIQLVAGVEATAYPGLIRFGRYFSPKESVGGLLHEAGHLVFAELHSCHRGRMFNELEADFFAGYALALWQEPVDDYLSGLTRLYADMKRLGFRDGATHGTVTQRRISTLRGFGLGRAQIREEPELVSRRVDGPELRGRLMGEMETFERRLLRLARATPSLRMSA